MQRPLVSIIIDNFNYDRFLRQSIDSALNQSYPSVEVIVVDDVSTDNSASVIASYGNRIKSISHSSNGGQAAAFNSGLAASRGEIIFFLDADDWLYPFAVERVIDSWIPGSCKTHFRLDLVDVDGTVIDMHPAAEVLLDDGDVLPQLMAQGRYETVVTSGNAWARAALLPNFPIPEASFRIAADGYLATVAPFHGPVTKLEERLGAYRVHGTNAFAAGPSEQSLDALQNRTRQRLHHDESKLGVLQGKLDAHGLPPLRATLLHDALHVELRLASLRLDPAAHPYPLDRRRHLTWKGLLASRRARLSPPRRMLYAAWFLAAGLLPKDLAKKAILWKMLPSSRPAVADRGLKSLRRLLG